MITKSDILVFCFDLKNYLDEPAYERQVNARFDFINDKFKKLNKRKANFVKLATHKDQLSSVEDAIKEFELRIKKKRYNIGFRINLFPIDLTKKEDCDLVLNKIF